MRSFILMVLVALMSACTSQEKARDYGGTTTLNLPVNEKLVTITWKETHIWYLTRPMMATDSAVTYQFRESSSFGVWNGTVVVVESKK